MQRGAFVIVIQILVALSLFALGLWALLRPRHFQAFINVNFALLPAQSERSQVTPAVLRALGVFLLWYGYMFSAAFWREISWFGWLFQVG